jgi:hypothetical protein
MVATLVWQAVPSVVAVKSSTFVSGTSDEGAKDTSGTDHSPTISNEKARASQPAKAGSKEVKVLQASFEGRACSSSK